MMTPTKSCQQKRGSMTRYSILSDPRLSQLFALSSQLEALAHSIDVQPPELPPKPPNIINNNHEENEDSPIKYKRLRDDEENNEILLPDPEELINVAPPPRYSTLSDSHMSTSSQGADSTPSANSVLSESSAVMLLHQSEASTIASSAGSKKPGETPVSEAEWQARCIELELALQKFRDQAHNIRKLLRDKLSELEQRVVEAESRAEDAEGKVRLMERRLNEVEWSTTSVPSDSSNLYSSNHELHEVDEKDRLIRTLESEVEAQRALRLADAKAVEAKAARIKEWVTNKLRELEEQNAHLKVQNAKANNQMELLRNRLEQLQVLGASTKSRQCSMAEQDSSLGSFEGDPVASEESLTDIGISKKSRTTTAAATRPLEATAAAAPTSLRSTKNSSKEPRAASEIEANNLSSSQVIRRPQQNGCSSVAGHDSGSVDLETPVEMSPKSPLEALDEALMAAATSSPIAPPRTKMGTNGATRSHKGRSESECEAKLLHHQEVIEDLPDRHKSLIMPLAPLPITKKLSSSAKKAHLMMSDEVHDYSEIYTPSAEVKLVNLEDTASTTSMSADSSRSIEVNARPPPPPPLHRYPSWEDRIYKVAKEGMKDAAVIDSHNNNSSCEAMTSLRGGYGSDINVPVYATVKGRASQIRSVPFTGEDSSDDSDSEAERLNINQPEDVLDGVFRGTSSSRNTTATTTNMTSSTSGDVSLASMPRAGLQHQPHSKPASTNIKHFLLCPSPINKASAASATNHRLLDASFDSDLSNDYAIPPDASSSLGLNMPSTPSRMLVSMESPRKSLNNVEKALEKSGYLTKLGGKIKSWKKRYFVLRNGTLSFWKSQHDVLRKPQGLIILDEKCRVSRADGANTFEIATESKTYYLTADSQPLMEDWVRVLQNVVQRNALKLLLSREEGISPTLQGWLLKVKNGHSRKVWCLLVGKMFVYFKCPNDCNPAGQINMRDTRVEEVDHISSDSDSDEPVERSKEPTIGIFPNHLNQQGPTYLIFNSKADKEQWLYHLTVVSGGDPKAGTQFEQLIQKIMEEDGSPQSPIWRHPLMVHSKDPISSPLTTFTSEQLQSEALKLFKSLLLFTNAVMDSAGIDYHVMLAGNLFQMCLDHPGLQEELLCALCKQTSRIMTQSSRHGVQSFLMNATQLFSCDGSTKSPPGSGAPPSISANHSGGLNPASSSSSSSSAGPDKANPSTHVFIQGWMLMSLAVSIFVPKSSKVLWFLRAHFARNKDSKTECGKYAAYCARALERSVVNGARQAKPSRMEVLSILLKNPHHHSLPHALPVHFTNDTYQVVGFDGSTTIGEFLQDLNQEMSLRSVELSGFTIYSDDPLDKDLYHALHLEDKVCDVISRWETALRERGMGKFENKRAIRFVYQNRLFWRKHVAGEVDRERLLLTYQVSKQIVQGRFPLNKELAFELAALMAQIHYGDLSLPEKTSSGSSMGAQKQVAFEVLEKFFPPRYIESSTTNLAESYLIEKWASLRGKSVHDCVRIFLNCTRKWQFFGAQLFNVQVVEDGGCPSPVSGDQASVWMAVNEDGIAILDLQSMQPLAQYSYDTVVTFGGCQEDFMLVVTSDLALEVNPRRTLAGSDRASSEDSSGTIKLLFNAGKPQILQMTLLIADYMNMMGKTAPGTLTCSTPLATPKSRASRSSSRARCHQPSATAPNTPKPEPRSSNNRRKKSLLE